MRTWGITLAFVGALTLVSAAPATDYDDQADGNWNDPLTWADVSYPGTGDTATIDSNWVIANIAIDTGITSIDVQTNGTFRVDPLESQAGLSIQLSGGRFGPSDYWSATYDGNLALAAATSSTIYSGGSGESWFIVNGQISGAGKLIFDAPAWYGGGGGQLHLTNAANSYSGGTDLVKGRLEVEADGALGSGDVHVTTGSTYYDGLVLWADQTTNVPMIYADTNGWVSLQVDPGVTPQVTVPITLNGGMLMGSGLYWSWSNWTQTHTGAISLTADSFLGTGESSGTLDLQGQITESGGSFKLTKGEGVGTVRLNNSGNAYSGGTAVDIGTIEVSAAGALGSGAVTIEGATKFVWSYPNYVKSGGRMRTSADGALDSISAAGATVKAQGVLQIESAEGGNVAKPLNLDVKAGGSLRDTVGTTVYVYSGASPNIALEQGAILDLADMAKAPVYADAAGFGTGDTRFGLYLGRGGSDATEYTNALGNAFGDDGATSVWRGLGASYGANLVFTGTAEEVTGGTAGLEFYSQIASTLTFSGATLTPAGTNTAKLYGPGSFVFAGTNTFGTADMHGSGVVCVNDAGGLAAGQTLNVHSGWLDVNAPDALAVGAAVNIKNGGGFIVDQDLAAGGGAVVVENKGWVSIDAGSRLASVPNITWQTGSQLCFTNHIRGVASPMPGGGNADYLLPWYQQVVQGGIQLGDNTRVTCFADYLGGEQPCTLLYDPGNVDNQSGPITLAGGATAGRLAAHGGQWLGIEAQVNLGTGKLIVGETGTYQVPMLRGAMAYGVTPVSQDGTVHLANRSPNANVIGSIEIQAGTLRVDDAAQLGGASVVDIKQPGTLYLHNSMELGCALTGTGTINSQWGGQTLTLRAGSISPGSSAGVLTLNGHLDFAKDVPDPFAQLLIDITGPNAGEGSDYDQLIVSGDVTNLINGGLVVDIAPALTQADLAGDVLTILTCANDLTGQEFGSVVWTAGWTGTVTGGVGFIELSDIGIGLPPLGDANGDGCVDGADYTVWADHYLWTGQAAYSAGGWSVGNWNEDQIVDGADYTLWADHYRQGCPSSAVPEPTCVVLVTLAAAALLRRRR